MLAPLVSVIVPSYRHENYILECLRSIGDQTYPRLELIVIDDCSPDATFALAQALLRTPFAKRFESVVLRRKEENRGADDSLNVGIELAKGDYIALINSDDLFRPKRVERLVEATRERGCEFGFTGVETIVDAALDPAVAKAQGVRFPDGLILLRLRQSLAVARERRIGYALLRQNVAISTGNFFFSRRLAEDIGGFQPLKYCHDWDFILQALLRTEPVFVEEPLYEYRLHPANSFRSLQHLAEAETEVVLRRFFREVLAGNVSNPSCPSPVNDWGYFEAFLAHADHRRLWAKEAGLPSPGERVREPSAGKALETLVGFGELLCQQSF
jgi:glycosyltransferase involved in cell wall biosynthesis